MQRHIITSEYPPQPGGVSDYTHQVAGGLADEGEDVHVWCPALLDAEPPASATKIQAITIHRSLGRVTPLDLKKVGEQLDRFPAPRRILVQYVPHGYGCQSMNVPFCLWLWRRVRQRGDELEIMVHEPFLSFGGSWRQYGAALIHRVMTIILLRAASKVWFSAPVWERRWQPYRLGRRVPFQWLPVPSNVQVSGNQASVATLRGRYVREGALLLGHFGTYGKPVLSVLEPILKKIVQLTPEQPLLLMGRNSVEFRQRLIAMQPAWGNNLHATGPLDPEDLSCHLAACDLLIQPYPDGATTRRGSLMVGISHGKPIVTTRSSSTEPVWERSGAVGIAQSGDADAFVQVLLQLMQDPGERCRMSDAARRLYKEQFDISRTIAALRAPEVSGSGAIVCAS